MDGLTHTTQEPQTSTTQHVTFACFALQSSAVKLPGSVRYLNMFAQAVREAGGRRGSAGMRLTTRGWNEHPCSLALAPAKGCHQRNLIGRLPFVLVLIRNRYAGSGEHFCQQQSCPRVNLRSPANKAPHAEVPWALASEVFNSLFSTFPLCLIPRTPVEGSTGLL